MDDIGSIDAITRFMTERLGARRAMLAVVLAGALVTYGGVSPFVAFFVLAPIAIALEREQHLFSVCLAMKPVGEPDAGNPHVRFDNDGLPRKRNG